MRDLEAALGIKNVTAFLRAIRLGEGTSDDMGYHRLVGGGNFESLADHPNVLVWIPKYKVHSTAAGAYQIIHPTWIVLAHNFHFPDFSEKSQDKAAVALIDEHSAIGMLEEGKVYDAIYACRKTWASLPGSPAGQRTEPVDRVVDEYTKWGGTVA